MTHRTTPHILLGLLSVIATALSWTTAHAEPATAYLELPIQGQIGTDVTPEAVDDVLKFATERGIAHVVIRIDTGGGFVPPAEAIWKTMGQYDKRLDYHAILDKCISAGIWMAFASDTLHIPPHGIMGAASVHDTLTSNTTRINKKSSSIFAAEIGNRAAAKGYPLVLVRAMVLPGAEAWVWTDATGQRRITGYRPDPGTYTGLTALDNHHTLLTLTAQEAALAGLAQPTNGDADSLGSTLEHPHWQRASGFGITRLVRQRYQRNLDDFANFNQELRSNTALLSWVDNRTNAEIPSLFGIPQPGLEKEAAEKIFADMTNRLDKVLAVIDQHDPERVGTTDPDAWAQARSNAELAWRSLDRLVDRLEDDYKRHTGRDANLTFLRPGPTLDTLRETWDRTAADAGL